LQRRNNQHRNTMTPSICFATDDSGVLMQAAPVLIRSGFAVWLANSAEAFCEDARSASAVCMIIDMPQLLSLRLLAALRGNGVRMPVMFVTDGEPAACREKLAGASVLDVLQRPVDMHDLLTWIECICVANLFTLTLRSPQQRKPERKEGKVLAFEVRR
jgi:FixJ family two-component response regulator